MSRLLCCLALLVGCSAPEPQSRRWDAGAAPALDLLLPDGLAQCPSPSTLLVTLDSYPDPACHTTQPFRGKAPGADRVVVQGGAGAAQPAQVSSDGSFCVEVLLKSGELNTLTFSAVDASGCPGQDLVRTVTHQSCGQADAGAAAPATNAALGATVNSGNPDKGDRSYLVDGKLSTVVKYKGGWGVADADIKIDLALAKNVEIQRIVVRWDDAQGDGCDYGKEYKLYTAIAADPGKVGDGGWQLLQDVSDGDGGEDSFQLQSPLSASHVGLKLDNNGCSGWSEGFALREVEVWATDPSAAALPADRCL